MANTRLLLGPTTVMGTPTSVNCCYCWTCGTRTVAARAYSSDRHFDISGPLLLLEMWHTHTVAASAHSSDGHSDIRGSFLLLDMWHKHGYC
jgi:hypothetical protein